MEPLAIVGLSFKLPQGTVDDNGLWDVLVHGKNLMTEWPENRGTLDSLYENGTKKINTIYARGGHFITEDPGVFDATFFSIAAKEAAAIDPQHRWAMEAAYHAFENGNHHLLGSSSMFDARDKLLTPGLGL
ncbi:beta-ketoacyl synthase [Xylaria castorea]|nr:beta-ketoacyl synthase [Xylaria castorea]